jgi:hypothetical protein
LGDYEIVEKRGIGPHGKYLLKHATIRNTQTGHKEDVEERLRLYTKEELEIMLTSAGFTIEETYGDYSKNPFVESVSERVIIIGGK